MNNPYPSVSGKLSERRRMQIDKITSVAPKGVYFLSSFLYARKSFQTSCMPEWLEILMYKYSLIPACNNLAHFSHPEGGPGGTALKGRSLMGKSLL